MDSLLTIFILLSAVVFIVVLINPPLLKRIINSKVQGVGHLIMTLIILNNHYKILSTNLIIKTLRLGASGLSTKSIDSRCSQSNARDAHAKRSKAMKLITQEVIKFPLQTLNYDDNYTLILDIIQTSKIHWGEYPSLKQIYKNGFEA